MIVETVYFRFILFAGTVKNGFQPALLAINDGQFDGGVGLKGHVAFFKASTSGLGSALGTFLKSYI